MNNTLLVRNFQSEIKLIQWLDMEQGKHESPESFYGWLEGYLEEGNEICIQGSRLDYATICEIF